LDGSNFRDKIRHIPFAREGIPYVLVSAFVTLVFALLGLAFLTWVSLAVALLVGHFFRDPERITSAGPDEVVSPADGKVISLERVEETVFFRKPVLRISIFMSVFDVHVNRIPFSGRVQGLQYRAGRFLSANLPRAMKENEQNWMWIQTESGKDIVITQVAGLIARRIVCWPSVGDRVCRAERFGMIRFGSRMDVYVPEDSEIVVSVGSHVHGGETVLCRLT
jgi:phosphatidylserine decarboxylase